MAVITPTVVPVAGSGYGHTGGALVITWSAILAADTCTPVQVVEYADRSVQFAGTFGAATVVLNGSNDGSAYVTLTDPQGNAVSAISAEIETVMELTRYIKPVTSGGDGTSSVNVVVVARKGS